MSGVDDEWAAHNEITARFAFSHHLAAVFPPSLFAEHPEFFPLVDGRRLQPSPGSGSWNPDLAREDVARYAAEAARKHFEANPDAVSFPLGVNDALVWGESPELVALTRDRRPEAGALPTRTLELRNSGIPASDPPAPGLRPSETTPSAWFRERPDYSNLVFTFMNRAAAELEKTHPDKYLGALAYYWAENVPDFPLHPQVVPFLTADRAQGYDAGFKREELELQAKWGALRAEGRRTEGRNFGVSEFQNSGVPSSDPRLPASDIRPAAPDRRLGMYDYLYGGGFLIPRIHPRLLAENLRHARSVGFTDYYAEVYANWGLDGPMPWLAAQLLQDPTQPLEPLLDEYYARYFREAAEPLRKFFARCEELWMTQPGPPYWLKHFRNQSQAVVFPAAARRELRGYLEEGKRQAWFGRTRARVEQVSAAFGVTERFIDFHEARDRLTRLALAAQPAADEMSVALGTYLEARRDFIRHTEDLLRRDPLAVRRFGWDDYLKDDPVPLALFALARNEVGGQRAEGGGSAVGPPLAGGPLDRNGILSGRGPATSRFDTLTAGRPVSQAPSSSKGAGPTILDEPDVQTLWEAVSAERRAAERGDVRAGKPETSNSGIPAAADHPLSSDLRPPSSGPRQLLRNADMTGDVAPARTIAGLPYGVALPAEWQSRVEPAQFHRAELVDVGAGRAVRISGTKDTTVSQWAPMPGPGAVDSTALQQAEISVRGRVSPGTVVQLVFSWLDANQRHVGFKTVRLPDGEWPSWVTLRQAGVPPAGAVWVGLGLRVQNQVAGDWVEARGWSILDF